MKINKSISSKSKLLLYLILPIIFLAGVSYASASTSNYSCTFLDRVFNICYDGYVAESQGAQAREALNDKDYSGKVDATVTAIELETKNTETVKKYESLKSSENIITNKLSSDQAKGLISFIKDNPKDKQLCLVDGQYKDTKGKPCNRAGSGAGLITFVGNSAGFPDKQINFKIPKFAKNLNIQACAAGGGGGGGTPGLETSFFESESYDNNGVNFYQVESYSSSLFPAGGGGGGGTAGECESWGLNILGSKNMLQMTIGSPGAGGEKGYAHTPADTCSEYVDTDFWGNHNYIDVPCPLAKNIGFNTQGVIFPFDMPFYTAGSPISISTDPIRYSFFLEGGPGYMYSIPDSLGSFNTTLYTEQETIEWLEDNYYDFLYENYLEYGSVISGPVTEYFDEKIKFGSQDGKDAGAIFINQINLNGVGQGVYSYNVLLGGDGGDSGLLYNQTTNDQEGIYGGPGGQGGSGTVWPWWHNGATGQDAWNPEQGDDPQALFDKLGYVTGIEEAEEAGGRGGHGESFATPLDGDNPNQVASPTGYTCSNGGSSAGGGGGWHYPEQGQYWSGGTNGCSADLGQGAGGGGGGAPHWVPGVTLPGDVDGMIGGTLSSGYKNYGGTGGDGGEGFVIVTWE